MLVMFRAVPAVGAAEIVGNWRQCAGNVLDRRVFKSAGFGVGSPQSGQSGEMHEQICDQAFDAGDVVAGAGRGARRHRGLRRARQRSAAAVSDKGKKKKTSEALPASSRPHFADGYRAAYATIYDRHDYASAIEQLKALGHDDIAAVANLIGYSYRKLGDYKVSQIWYERALKADPNHVKTWQYYGLWQVEQGNRDQAQYHLNRIAALAGTDSEEYRSLAAALEKPPGHRPRLLSFQADRQVQPAQRKLRRFCFAPALTSSAPAASARNACREAVARIEHVAAGIDDELHAVGRGKGRQLVEQDLRGEIRRGEIEQPVPDQQLQLRIEREDLPQLGNRLGRI